LLRFSAKEAHIDSPLPEHEVACGWIITPELSARQSASAIKSLPSHSSSIIGAGKDTA